MPSKFKLALLQMGVSADKASNLSKAAAMVATAAKEGAQIISLPECFNSPYGTQHFNEYSENIPEGDSVKAMQKMATDNNV